MTITCLTVESNSFRGDLIAFQMSSASRNTPPPCKPIKFRSPLQGGAFRFNIATYLLMVATFYDCDKNIPTINQFFRTFRFCLPISRTNRSDYVQHRSVSDAADIPNRFFIGFPSRDAPCTGLLPPGCVYRMKHAVVKNE